MSKHDNIYAMVTRTLGVAVSDDYVRDIVDDIIYDVVNDVDECADPDCWNDDDVRLAVGRVLKSRLGIDN